MSIKLYQVDAFTLDPFKGNPAGVCVLDDQMPVEWMQSIAKEMNVAETAFLFRINDKYSLRWFTPEVEVDLCGHATLASAHILWQYGYLQDSETALFDTKSGLLKANLHGNWIQLDFPATPVEACAIPEDMEKTLGAEIKYFGKSKFDYFAELESEEIVRSLNPDISSLSKYSVRGIIVTSSSKEYDFISRFFAPQSGIMEDPVTGSAHSALYPYWSDKLNKKELNAYQASERGGNLKLDSKDDRILISGKAVTVFEIELKI